MGPRQGSNGTEIQYGRLDGKFQQGDGSGKGEAQVEMIRMGNTVRDTGCSQEVITPPQPRREPATLKTSPEKRPKAKHGDKSERIQKRSHYRISTSCRRYPTNARIVAASEQERRKEAFEEIITRKFSK